MRSETGKSIAWFADIAIGDRPAVGGKGASLGELTRAGVRVPPGFVVATAAFWGFLAGIDPDKTIPATIDELDSDDLLVLSAVTQQIRERIEIALMPRALQDEIVSAYLTLIGDKRDAPVAVRSSATSEDSVDASFAGLQDTYLWVRGETEVLHAVRACWASLYSSESVTYRLRRKLPEENLAMGVVVQRMVNSCVSGVMFTRSPATGDRSVIAIEGSWGLGSAIVSGEVTPDKYVVNKVTGEIVKRTISTKSMEHLPEPMGGVRDVPVPIERQTIACLDDEDIRALAQIGRDVEKHYGAPQDIEWAIERHNSAARYSCCKRRPETVWANREGKEVTTPKATAFEHVFDLFGRRTGIS